MKAPITVLALLALAAPAAHAQLFKCVKDGRTVYQDGPCDESAQQSTVRPPPPAPEAPAPAPQEAKPGTAPPAPPPATGNAAQVVAGFAVCSETVPNFARKYTDAFEGWKMRNATAVSRLSNEPDASQLDARLRQERERAADGSLGSMAEHCAGIATTIQPARDPGAPRVVK